MWLRVKDHFARKPGRYFLTNTAGYYRSFSSHYVSISTCGNIEIPFKFHCIPFCFLIYNSNSKTFLIIFVLSLSYHIFSLLSYFQILHHSCLYSIDDTVLLVVRFQIITFSVDLRNSATYNNTLI